jgi:N-acetylneuraminate synthase
MADFIAEVSSNHSKDIDRAIQFIECASKVGCDAIKFQLFKIEELFAPEILEISKQHRDRKEWELPLEFLPILYKKCKEKEIKFGCTPFYLDAVSELKPYVDFYKIASYELLWDDLLIACALTKKPVIISTGMANLDEIIHAVEVLRKNKCEPTILHCVSAYPTSYNEANLSAIDTIRKATKCRIGWSDHTVNSGVIHRAINKWDAKVIEFHLDIDGAGDEYSQGHCWLPDQISTLIEEVKHAEAADGDGLKKAVASEINDRLWRTDASDGLRPMKSIRDNFSSE